MLLKDGRETLCYRYSDRVNMPSNRLFYLLPPKSEHQSSLPSITAKTEGFRNSFIP